MGERRQDQRAPAVETTEELGAIQTACTIFDNEIERFARLLGARENLRPVTAQVRELLDVVQPLQQRKEALEGEIARVQEQRTHADEEAAEALKAIEARTRDAEGDLQRLHELVEQTKAQVAAERTTLREELAAAREAHQSELRTLMEVTDARKQDLAKMLEEAEAAHTQRLADMQEELARVQDHIEEAQRLRDQLTAIRG